LYFDNVLNQLYYLDWSLFWTFTELPAQRRVIDSIRCELSDQPASRRYLGWGWGCACPSPHFLDADAAASSVHLLEAAAASRFPSGRWASGRRVRVIGVRASFYSGLPSALIVRSTTKARTNAIGPAQRRNAPDAPAADVLFVKGRHTTNVRSGRPARTPLLSPRSQAVINLAHVAKIVRYRRAEML